MLKCILHLITLSNFHNFPVSYNIWPNSGFCQIFLMTYSWIKPMFLCQNSNWCKGTEAVRAEEVGAVDRWMVACNKVWSGLSLTRSVNTRNQFGIPKFKMDHPWTDLDNKELLWGWRGEGNLGEEWTEGVEDYYCTIIFPQLQHSAHRLGLKSWQFQISKLPQALRFCLKLHFISNPTCKPPYTVESRNGFNLFSAGEETASCGDLDLCPLHFSCSACSFTHLLQHWTSLINHTPELHFR